MSFQRFFQVARQLVAVVLAGIAAVPTHAATSADQASLVAANNQFSFDLMQQVVSAQTNANVFLSPFSAATALQMVANGAAGQTKKEIQQVLHTTGMTDATLNESFQTLNQSFTSRSNVTLTLANGLWVQPEFPLKPDFVAENHQYFGAELATLDFNQPAAAEIINDWANKDTHGKIPKIVQYPFDLNLRLLLANAIYFKGSWLEPFQTNLTRPHDFHLPGGNTITTALMSQEHEFEYEETESYQALRLPYHGWLRMAIFLPATNHTPQQLVHDFGNSSIWQNNIQPAFRIRAVTIGLPKFKIDCAANLNRPLQSLGINSAFDRTANFSGISPESLFISLVNQNSFVEVNEAGTEAAAETQVSIFGSIPRAGKMIVDRPFLFTIEDMFTGSIVFMGIINNPETD